jgi:hypothetical protein
MSQKMEVKHRVRFGAYTHLDKNVAGLAVTVRRKPSSSAGDHSLSKHSLFSDFFMFREGAPVPGPEQGT